MGQGEEPRGRQEGEGHTEIQGARGVGAHLTRCWGPYQVSGRRQGVPRGEGGEVDSDQRQRMEAWRTSHRDAA